MAENQVRKPRETETREVQSYRPESWRPPEVLPMPDARPGWIHRYAVSYTHLTLPTKRIV